METLTKVCTKCKTEKPLSEFGIRRIAKDGRRSECKQCRKDQYVANKETVLQERKEYYESNKAKRLAYARDHHQKTYTQNKEKINERNKTWYRNNTPAFRARDARRRAALIERIPPWMEEDLIQEVYRKRDELSELWGITLNVDHVIPLQGENVSGLHCWQNLQLLEASDNISKGNKFTDEGC